MAPSENPQFKGVFVCLSAIKVSFLEDCKPFITLDGCHLKGPSEGILICVVSHDGDKGLFPIAYIILKIESTNNWKFFLLHLRGCISQGRRRSLTPSY